eukprot:6197267-Heterocapsa_arctica.AAC.1
MVFAQDRLVPYDGIKDAMLRGTNPQPRKYISPVYESNEAVRIADKRLLAPIKDNDILQFGSDLPASEEVEYRAKFEKVKVEEEDATTLSSDGLRPPPAPDEKSTPASASVDAQSASASAPAIVKASAPAPKPDEVILAGWQEL